MHHETEAEVLARIEATRARMGETIDRIGDRVNPDRVQAELKARAREQVREAKATVKTKARSAMRDMEHGVSDAGRGVWDAIRDNPIPAGMVGVGLAWLLANGVRDDHDVYRGDGYAAGYRGHGRLGDGAMYPEEEAIARPYGADDRDLGDRDLGDRAREKAHAAREKVEDAKERVEDAAGEVRERASELRDRASERMDAMEERARRTAREAKYRARRAERRVEDSVRENPLAAGAIAAALGFAAGMMIPESHRENEMFGPARDRLMDRAEARAREAGSRAKETLKETASEVRETAKRGAREALEEVKSSSSSERSAVTEPGR